MNHTIRQTLRPPTVGRALLVVVLLALIAPFVVYAVPATVGAEASYVVLTASMTPAIAPGDVVIVDSVPAREIVVGDVIVFEQRTGDAIPITHRVIGVERPADAPPAFQTKGDANEDADLTPVTPDRVIGRVVFSIPLIGHVIQFVGTPAGFVALVVLPLGLLVVSEVTDLLRAGRPGASAAHTADAETATDGGAAKTTGASDAAATTVAPDDHVVITPADLTLSSVVLGAFGVYAGYVALQGPTALSVTLAIAVGALFVLSVALRLFAPFDAATAADRTAAAPTVRIDGGRPTGPTVDVATPADLSAIAATLGRPLLHDDRDRYVVLDGAVTYACDVPAVPDDETSAEVDAIERHLGPTDDDTGRSTASEPLPSAAIEPRSAGR